MTIIRYTVPGFRCEYSERMLNDTDGEAYARKLAQSGRRVVLDTDRGERLIFNPSLGDIFRKAMEDKTRFVERDNR